MLLAMDEGLTATLESSAFASGFFSSTLASVLASGVFSAWGSGSAEGVLAGKSDAGIPTAGASTSAGAWDSKATKPVMSVTVLTVDSPSVVLGVPKRLQYVLQTFPISCNARDQERSLDLRLCDAEQLPVGFCHRR